MTRCGGQVFCSDMFRPSMSRVFLNFASLSNLRKPLFVSWHAQHVNAATGRYKDMSSSWGKTKEAATGDLSLWKHNEAPPHFQTCSSTGKVLPWNSDLKPTRQAFGRLWIKQIILKDPRTAKKSRTCNMKMARFYESLTARRKGGHLRLQQL